VAQGRSALGADLTPRIQATAAYGPLCALFHDSDRPDASAAEIAWYGQRLPRDAGSALDLMCGSGRVLAPLLASGLHVHGVDVSQAMLDGCRARLAGRGLDTSLMRQDIADLNLPFRYGAAFVAAGSFQLIAQPDRARAALERVRAHLIDPGWLILDLNVPAEGAQRLGAALVEVRTARIADGTQIAVRSETIMNQDARLATTSSRYVQRRGNVRLAEENETTNMTWYTRDEIGALVEAAGFREIAFNDAPVPRSEGEAFAVIARM
jgi:SAM-dependent methyltransferase